MTRPEVGSSARRPTRIRTTGQSMGNAVFRLPRPLYEQIVSDLRRPHAHAFERVGFLSLATGSGEGGELIVIGSEYQPVHDDHYLKDPGVGARIGTQAIREAIARTLSTGRGLLHVHLHDHDGVPDFSLQDTSDQPRLVRGLVNALPNVPQGMMVLSASSAHVWLWLPGMSGPSVPRQTSIVGYPAEIVFAEVGPSRKRSTGQSAREQERSARQSFLGPRAEPILRNARIGIIGLGGGGGHVSQQLAHVGFLRVRGFDGDVVEESNLNRLIGGRASDVRSKTKKNRVADRLYRSVLPRADVAFLDGRWQDSPERVRSCDVVVGCVDTFAGRYELEAICRRYAIPYIDIGMDVHQVPGEPPRMAGQVILSLPGGPCMWCLGFLDQDKLGREAQRYGDTGGRPQVVWPNGVLASTAVGLVVDILTSWTATAHRCIYLSYDGNSNLVRPHPRLAFLSPKECPHYQLSHMGDPVFR